MVAAFRGALEESLSLIKAEPARVAALWIKAEERPAERGGSRGDHRGAADPWTSAPLNMLTYLDYMNRAGLVSAKAADQGGELFFPGAATKAER